MKKLNALSAAALALSALAVAPVQAQQGELDFSISEDTAKIQITSFIPYNDLSWSGEYLHFEDDTSDVDANILGAGVFVAGRSNASTARQTVGLGGKFLFVDADGADTGAGVAVGGFIRHTLSQANLISLRGEAFISPSIMSFQGMENYFEVSGRVEYQLLEQANVYLGYRNIQADLDVNTGGEAEYQFEEGIIAGVNLRF